MRRNFFSFVDVICSAIFIRKNKIWLTENEDRLYREIVKLLIDTFNDKCSINQYGDIFFRHKNKDQGYRLIYRSDGIKVYMLSGNAHREDGPAYIDSHKGYEHWYLNGKIVSKEDVFRHAVKRGNKEAVKRLLWNKY